MFGRIPSRGSDQFVVRMPDGMRERLKAEAEANGRSMNAEIVARLEATLTKRIGEPGFSAQNFTADELRGQMLDLASRMNSIAALFDQVADKAREAGTKASSD